MDFAAAMRGAQTPSVVDDSFANILQLTGDQGLATAGRAFLQQNANRRSSALNLALEAERSKQTAAWREAQQSMADRRFGLDKDIYDQNVAKFEDESAREWYELLQEQSEGPEYKRLTESARKDLEMKANSFGNLRGLVDVAKASRDANLSLTAPVGIIRSATNFAANNFGDFVDDETKAVAQFWQAMDRFYTLDTRNALFGATLTPSEERAWDSANPSKGQSMDSMIAALESVLFEAEKKAMSTRDGLVADFHNPEVIQRSWDQASRPIPLSLLNDELAKRSVSARSSVTSGNPRSVMDYGNGFQFNVLDAPPEGEQVIDMSSLGQRSNVEITPEQYQDIARGFFK